MRIEQQQQGGQDKPPTGPNEGAKCTNEYPDRAPQVLAQALALLPPQHDANLLVDTSTADDAGVYKVTVEIALVQTVDFFTPIVDDPYTVVRIAAANSLSDVYAMGGRPLTALNIA